MRRMSVWAIGLMLVPWGSSRAAETVRFRETGSDRKVVEREIVGELLVEAQDGGMMLLADDGQIWTVQPQQLIERRSDDAALRPVDADEIERRLLAELPERFHAFRTSHYVIVHDTDERYARRVGELFERLHRGFFIFWKNQGWELPEPRFPLVALVLNDRASFLQHAGSELGSSANQVIGYYHLATNRMTTYFVPNLERNIATIIHEATHQLAYNCGLQRRFADNPMWVSEGLAMFFEAPDFSNPRGWRGIGLPNQVNLARWKRYLPRRPAESLTTLLGDDDRLRSAATAEAAYAESWALTYFLLKTRRQEYVEYLQKLSEGRPLAERSPKERIEMFEDAFGESLASIDRSLVDYMRRVR